MASRVALCWFVRLAGMRTAGPPSSARSVASRSPAPRRAREQRKMVTVLFCDVTGSTALGESIDPEALRGLLARYFERMKAIVERHGGRVEKFIGDAVMAVFGVPACTRTMRCARAGRRWRCGTRCPSSGCRRGSASSTGEVVTGTEERLVTGDAVNVAARLEQAAQPGEVLIGESTLALVARRGRGRAGRAAGAEGQGASRCPPFGSSACAGRRSGGTTRPFVGRERELALLGEAWERVRAERRCELVTVIGDAGVGKSRLVAEALAAIERELVRGRCLPYGEGITYWPVVEVLKQLDVLPPTRRPRRRSARCSARRRRRRPRRRSPGRSARRSSRPRPTAAGRRLRRHPVGRADVPRPGRARRAALLAARRSCSSAWRGPSCSSVARPGRSPLRLDPLGDEDVDEPDRRTGSPAELRERIARAAGGNPLFVEEMLAMAGEAEGEVVVPPTLQALLAARLDQLEPAERTRARARRDRGRGLPPRRRPGAGARGDAGDAAPGCARAPGS